MIKNCIYLMNHQWRYSSFFHGFQMLTPETVCAADHGQLKISLCLNSEVWNLNATESVENSDLFCFAGSALLRKDGDTSKICQTEKSNYLLNQIMLDEALQFALKVSRLNVQFLATQNQISCCPLNKWLNFGSWQILPRFVRRNFALGSKKLRTRWECKQTLQKFLSKWNKQANFKVQKFKLHTVAT